MTSSASLNHAYRTVWNPSLQAMVAVAEVAKTPRGGAGGGGNCVNLGPFQAIGGGWCALALGMALAWGLSPGQAFANPTGGVAVVGQATFVNQANTLLVTTQNGTGLNHSAINWQSFSVPAGNTTYFQQPGAFSTSINRVVTNTPTQIFGRLASNGNLVLVNQSGITVGRDAAVDTAGFTASSLKMGDADALAGRMRFGDPTALDGSVSVLGQVLARSGDVVLLGTNIATGKDALIQAPNGTTLLAAGQQIELTGRGLEGITLQVQAPQHEAVNLGNLQGNAAGIFAGTLKHSGLIQATAVAVDGGRVVLKAQGDAYVQGSGRIEAVGAVGKGGDIAVLGNRVAVTDNAVLDASGATGGGAVLVGGDYLGQNPALQNASVTYFGPDATIRADATTKGNGGKAIVWADDTTRAHGHISVRGGTQGGDGGFVETSGKIYLDATLAPDISAANGKAGQWLLDPSDLKVVAGAAAPVNLTGTSIFNTTADGTPSQISVNTINTALGLGNVEIRTTGYGGKITFDGAPSTGALLIKPANPTGPRTFTATAGGATGEIEIRGGTLTFGGGVPNVTFESNPAYGFDVYLNPAAGRNVFIDSTANLTFRGFSGGTLVAAIQSQANDTQRWDNRGRVNLEGESLINLKAGGFITSFRNNKDVVNPTLNINTTNTSSFLSESSNQNGRIDNASVINVNVDTSWQARFNQTSTPTGGGSNGTLNVLAGKVLTMQSPDTIAGSVSVGAGATLLLSARHSTAIPSFNGATLTGPGRVDVNNLGYSLSGASLTGDIMFGNGYGGGVFSTPASGVTYSGAAGYFADGALSLAGALTSGYGITLETINGSISDAGYGISTTLLKAKGGTGSTSITLNGVGHSVGTFSVDKSGSTNQVSMWNTAALTLGPISTVGSLSVKTNNANLTQVSGQSVVVGLSNSTTLETGTGNITLNEPANNFRSLSITQANQVSLTNGFGLTLQASNFSGQSTINSLGSLTVAGQITSTATDSRATSPTAAAAIKLESDGVFNYSNGYGSPISLTGLGHWLAVVPNRVCSGCGSYPPGENFRQYNYASGSTPIQATGSGVLIKNIGTSGELMGYGALVGSVSKIYDASTSISLSGASLNVSGAAYDGLTVSSATAAVTGTGTITLPDANAGTGKTVQANAGTTIGPLSTTASVTLYGLKVNSANLPTGVIGTVTPARAIATVGLSGSRPYDGTNVVNASIFSLSGLLFGETLSLSGAGTVADKNVGFNRPVTLGTLSLGNGTGLASNYTLGTATASITAAPLTLSAGSATKVYDGTTSATGAPTLSSGVLFGSDSIGGGTLSFETKSAGIGKTVTASGAVISDGNSGANYKVSYVPSSLGSITPKALGVTGISASSKAYDATTAASLSGGILSGVIAGDAVSVGTLTGAFADKNAGTAKAVTVNSLTLAGTDAGNYSVNPALLSSSSATITPKALDAGSLAVSDKVYDGTNLATLSRLGFTGVLANDVLSVLTTSATFDTKNVGVGKPVNIRGIQLAGADAANYLLLSTDAAVSASITPKPLAVSGALGVNKVYDGKTDATANVSGVVLSGAVAGDSLTVAAVTGFFGDRNVGINKPVTFDKVVLAGTDAGNYKGSILQQSTANISARELSNWIGGSSGLWSDPANWDVIPDGTNVLAVNVPPGAGTVSVDASAGNITLQSVTSGRNVNISGGSLQVSNGLTTSGFSQTGGSVSGPGAFKVNGSFSQSAGSLSFGSVDIVQNSLDLNLINIAAPAMVLTAQAGAIRGSGSIHTGALTTRSTAGTFLNNGGNRISNFTATNSGTGNIELVNTGVLTVGGINNAGGDITVANTGGITTVGLVKASGAVSGIANSPLTIGAAGVEAVGNVTLVATNLTSAGNMTLNGPISSSAGAVRLNAANNLDQNSSILAALGVSVSAGGVITFGPLATSGYQPLSYTVNDQPIRPPRPPASSSAAVDVLVSLMAITPSLAAVAVLPPIGTLLKPDEERDLSKELIVSEGQTCRP